MIRDIFRGFIGLILLAIAIFVVLIGVTAFRLLDANVYKATLDSSQAYTFTADAIDKYAQQLVSGINFDDQEVSLIIRKEVGAEIKTKLPLLAGADKLKTLAESNIDFLLQYLNGDADNWLVYIPKSDLRAVLLTSAINTVNRIDEDIQNLPTCNGPQTAKTVEDLVCVTAALKQQGGAKAFLNSAFPIDQLNDPQNLPQGLQFLQGDDKQPLAVYFQQLNADTPQTKEIINTAAQIKDLISTAKLLVLIGIVMMLLLLVIYLWAKHGGFLSKFKSALKIVFLVSSAVTAASGSVLIITSIWLSNLDATLSQNPITNPGPLNGFGDFAPLGTMMLRNLIGQIFIPTLVVAGAVAFISFVLWLVVRLLTSLIKTVE